MVESVFVVYDENSVVVPEGFIFFTSIHPMQGNRNPSKK